MMKQFDIDKAIYEKYIVPTKHKKGYMIGIEFEIPILNMSQEKIDFSVIQKVVLALREAFDLNIENAMITAIFIVCPINKQGIPSHLTILTAM